ncbi:hypothetical protein [Pseudomonas sp. GD03730]|uniref:hypothetical protein n=1 Tax=Pseudomonas sp. GD03730 TaxID=2975375 RepID=UPI002447ED53|nr:hypothetical protein [Pseudomonas sp. GD03730]MDH1403753.1 hypothetical protein [Pseudomonas sp. GD03730]
MNILLKENGEQLPTDVVLSWVLRSDLAPVPRTVEFRVKLIDGVEKMLTKGATIWTGRENLAYEIVFTDKAQPLGQVQGRNQQQSMNVIALLSSCANVAKPRQTAVVQEGQTFGAAYRACGAYTSIANDFLVPRFTCFRGFEPSQYLVQVLQEEGAALVLQDGQVSAMRLVDLMAQAPVDDIGQVDSSAKIESEMHQFQQVPSYYSTNDKADIVNGAMGQARRMHFQPGLDVRQLRNASSVLVRTKTVDSMICQQIMAGHVLRVAGENLVVLTAAHCMENNEGAVEDRSRLWLGKLFNAM